jgi:transposase
MPLRLSWGAFDEAVRETLDSHALLPMLAARSVLFDTLVELDRRVKRKAREDGLCRRFMGIPGVGEITALSFKAAVDDPDPMHARSGLAYRGHQTAKRGVIRVHDLSAEMNTELDSNARSEKRSRAPLRKGDVRRASEALESRLMISALRGLAEGALAIRRRCWRRRVAGT